MFAALQIIFSGRPKPPPVKIGHAQWSWPGPFGETPKGLPLRRSCLPCNRFLSSAIYGTGGTTKRRTAALAGASVVMLPRAFADFDDLAQARR
jgi:hypothetical protein